MIDHDREQLLTPAEAAKRLPSCHPGRKVHLSTIHRWFDRGDLEFVKIGGRKFTSVEAMQRFILRCNRQIHNTAPLPVIDSPRGTAAARQAMQQLQKMGI
jgi:hypothetical protein